ncbi:hypothetical protein JCM6882_007601 [Rhodosporidiobolus microsporus]
MRVKRWTIPSTARPPDPPAAPRPRLRSLAPPQSRPPFFHHSREDAKHRLRNSHSGMGNAPALAPPYNSPYFLASTLSHLPRISSPPRLNLRPVEDLEHQLATWRKACAITHSALAGPLAGSKDALQHRVAKVVGHTMRILLRLGQVNAAKELDRAFFSTESGRKRGKRRAAEGEAGKASEKEQQFVERWAERDGLGLARGEIRIAWMSSFAVRLDEAVQGGEDDAALADFGSLLASMYAQLGEQEVRQDPCLMAFLTRKMGVVQEQLAARRTRPGEEDRDGEDGLEETKEQVRRLLFNVKDAEADEVEVVSFALLETALERLERVKGNALEDPFFPKVEEDIQRLVGSLEATTEFRALHNLLLSFTSSVDRHAHILHLAIRFLLLRHRYHDPSSPSHLPSPLQSATQLYSLLLDLTPRVDPTSHTDLTRLRQRQSSALYRILAAHVSSLSPSSPEHLIPLATRALDLVDLTLSSLTPLASSSASGSPSLSFTDPPTSPAPSDPRILGISTRLFHRLMFALTSSLPAPPSLPIASGEGPHLTRTRYVPAAPWSLVARACDTIVAAKLHDAALSYTAATTAATAGTNPHREVLLEHEKPLFQQPNFAHQLVRAALMGRETGGRDETGATAEDETPLSRLSALLAFVADLERLSRPLPPLSSSSSSSSATSSPSADIEGSGERRARPLVLSAVRNIVTDEWRGLAAVEWRREVLGAVEGWAREGRDWGRVRGVVERRENGKGKGRGKGKGIARATLKVQATAKERKPKKGKMGVKEGKASDGKAKSKWVVKGTGKKTAMERPAQAPLADAPPPPSSATSSASAPSPARTPASPPSPVAKSKSKRPSPSSPPRSSSSSRHTASPPRAIGRGGKPAFFTPSGRISSSSS